MANTESVTTTQASLKQRLYVEIIFVKYVKHFIHSNTQWFEERAIHLQQL
jgi:hypothetical protein